MSTPQTEEKKIIVWSDIHMDFDAWKADNEEYYHGWTDDEMYCRMLDDNQEYLQDERINLKVQLTMPIVAIADLGRWNGRCPGYKVIESGVIADCLFTNCDMAEWYLDAHGDLRCDEIHHDGENHILYRVFKQGLSDFQREEFLEKIYEGTFTRADIEKVTRKLGNEIGRVYGFSFPKEKERERYFKYKSLSVHAFQLSPQIALRRPRSE